MKTRTDPHRPSAITPADYVLEDYFGYERCGTQEDPETGRDVPILEPYGEEARQAYLNGKQVGVYTGNSEKCDACGARYIHGATLFHKPTGGFVTFGQDCSTKYLSLRTLSKRERADRAWARLRRREAKAKNRILLAAHPGINAALKTDHYISRDLRAKAIKWGGLSDRQVELAFKLVGDTAKREAEKADAVPAPEGRFEVTGEILCTKIQDGFYGPQEKMLVKIETPDGHWKAWGTYPKSLQDVENRLLAEDQKRRDKEHDAATAKAAAELLEKLKTDPQADFPYVPKEHSTFTMKGQKVTFTATFERSDDDEDFAFFKRPSKAQGVAA